MGKLACTERYGFGSSIGLGSSTWGAVGVGGGYVCVGDPAPAVLIAGTPFDEVALLAGFEVDSVAFPGAAAGVGTWIEVAGGGATTEDAARLEACAASALLINLS